MAAQPHFLLVPYSEIGHVTPMLSLAVRLAALRCTVSFVTLDRKGQPLSAAAAKTANPCKASGTDQAPEAAEREEKVLYLDNLRFVALSCANDATDPEAMPPYEVSKKQMDSFHFHLIKDPIVKMIEDAMASPHPISCIIHEAHHLRWVREVVTAYGLHSALFAPYSALSFVELYHLCTGRESTELEDVYESGLGMIREMNNPSNGLVTSGSTPEMKLQMKKTAAMAFQGIQDAGPFLLNSFKELEAPLLPVIEAMGINVSFIGPCIPPWNLHDLGIWSQLSQQVGIRYTGDAACLTWLDEQKEGSVLYISFGSEGAIDPNQVEEIAMGIRESGYNFLWVIRTDRLSSGSPPQVSDAAGGEKNKKGVVVAWAPQREVLRHPSVGGFLTHCGWNSILEAVDTGVPMLCLPLQVDQPINASFVCSSYLQAGLQLRISQEGLVHREEVCRGVRAIMQGQFRERLSKFREASASALTRDADQELTAFVQAMR